MSYLPDSQPEQLISVEISEELYACLQHHPQRTFTVDDIERVAVVVGDARGETDRFWILELRDGRVILLQGHRAGGEWARGWATHMLLQRRPGASASKGWLARGFDGLVRHLLPTPKRQPALPLQGRNTP